MFKKQLATLLVAAAFSAPMLAQADEHHAGDVAVAIAYIEEIVALNKEYATEHGVEFFMKQSGGQHPRATVLMCADSRVHVNALDKTPEGDLFLVRNIGNQLSTSKGSVQYGVNHLASSLLLIMGHSNCGAIKAASGDYSALEEPIKKELETISIAKGGSNIDGVKTNVNNQVAAALTEWDREVKAGELLIVGAVYDFADEMHKGAGNFNIININGETDPARLNDTLALVSKTGHEQHTH